MKSKFIILFLIIGLIAFGVVGCGEDTAPGREPADGAHKLGLGVVTSIGSSRDAGGDVTARAQADVVMAAVLFDADGRVVSGTCTGDGPYCTALDVAGDVAGTGYLTHSYSQAELPLLCYFMSFRPYAGKFLLKDTSHHNME